MAAARSFSVVTQQPEEVGRALRVSLDALGGAAGGALVFLGGAMGRSLLDVGRVVASVAGGTPVLIASGAGVLTERGEYEDTSAASGVAWRGVPSVPFAIDVDPADGALSDRILTQASSALGGRGGAVALFASREVVSPTDLYPLDRAGVGTIVFGGGSLGRPGAVAVARGQVLAGDVVALAIRSAAPPIVRASPACRLIAEPQEVTEAEGSLLLRIGGRTALEALSSVAPQAPRGAVVVLAVEVPASEGRKRQLIVRGIRGVHEPRAGLVVSEDVLPGTRVAFAVIDARAARVDLETCLREVSRDTRGWVPLVGVYVDCAGRGEGLYGEKDVDVAAIRARWPGLPVAGIKTAFEVGPGRVGSTAHLYSAVMALFHAPS